MTPKAHKAMVQKIKIAQRQLQIDEDSYQSILANYGGLEADGRRLSATRLDGFGLANVLNRMRELGFKDTRPERAGRLPSLAVSKQAVGGKIQALLAEAGKSTAYADGIAKHMYKRDRIEFLTIQQMLGVVAALEKAAKKAGRPTR